MVVIAWVNGEWLGDKARADLIAEYRKMQSDITARFGVSPSAWPDDIVTFWAPKQRELNRLERVHRCANDLLEFALEYFGEARNPENDGNWEGFDIRDKSEAPAFHREINEIMDSVTNDKVAVAAPRSHAKSTYLSKAFPIHEVVYRLRKYTIIISETPNVAKGNMEWIRNQLKYNAKLRADFGPLLSPKDQANVVDNSESFVAWHEAEDGRKKQLALVESASTGQALRGRNWNGSRPDLIICDDLEDARPGGNASTPEQRQKLRDWFSQTVIPLGDPKGERTAFVYMGTTVAPDALLVNVLYNRSDFQSRIYRAIVSQPANAELWEKCREIYVNRDNPDRATEARKFYEQHRAEMEDGAEVLWPEVQPLWKLITWKWDNGSKAFNTEYMNNPIDEESQLFNPDNFTYYRQNSAEFQRNKYEISIGVDMAMGKQRGDYSAITVLAADRTTDTYYVADSYGDRVKVDTFIDVVVRKVIEWEPDVIAVEAVAAQEFFVDTLKRALTEAGYPAHTRVKKVYSRTRKDLRIEALAPEIETGRLQFNRAHGLLLEQFEQYPQSHDDCMDATEMAFSVAQKRKLQPMSKPVGF